MGLGLMSSLYMDQLEYDAIRIALFERVPTYYENNQHMPKYNHVTVTQLGVCFTSVVAGFTICNAHFLLLPKEWASEGLGVFFLSLPL